jgi:hypothetical protein
MVESGGESGVRLFVDAFGNRHEDIFMFNLVRKVLYYSRCQCFGEMYCLYHQG